MKDNEKRLDELIKEVLKQMQEREYSRKICARYRCSYSLLASISADMSETYLTARLLKAFLNKPVKCNEKWARKERTHRMRCVRLLSSLAQNESIDWGRQKPKAISAMLKTESFRLELECFVGQLEKDGFSPNTTCGYKRIVTYFLLFCQDSGYANITDIQSDDVSKFIVSLYRAKRYRPTTIGSSLPGLRKFLSRNEYTEPFSLEIPVHLPRERKIIEVYSDKELAAIESLLLSGRLTKRDTAICRLLMETGLRETDVRSLKLENIDWDKDTIHIVQNKTNRQLTLPLRASYGNAIADYILTERPHNESEYVFLKSLAPFTQLGKGAAYTILRNMETLAGIKKDDRIAGSRMTRHNAASSMLRAGIPMSDISAVLGHRDPNAVSVYLSTNSSGLADCTLRLPPVWKGGDSDAE